MPYFHLDDEDSDFLQFSVRAPGQSAPGVVSFILALITGAALFAIFCVLVTVLDEDPHPGEPTELKFLAALLAAGLSSLLGLGLGIVGCCQQGRKKVFAILGVVFNTVVLVGVSFLAFLVLLLGF